MNAAHERAHAAFAPGLQATTDGAYRWAMLLAADVPVDPHAFDATRENLGMAAMALIVLVAWLAYRKMIELSRRKASAEKNQEK